MAEKSQLAPPFQELTRLFLDNVRYHSEVVSRKNLDDFIVMVRDPVRLAQVYDQLALLRQDLKMGNIIPHDEVVYLMALTKHLPDPRLKLVSQFTQPPVKQASFQGLESHMCHKRTLTQDSQSSGGADSAVGQSETHSEEGLHSPPLHGERP